MKDTGTVRASKKLQVNGHCSGSMSVKCECLATHIRWNWSEPTSAEARIQLPQKWEKLARKFHFETTNTFETFQPNAWVLRVCGWCIVYTCDVQMYCTLCRMYVCVCVSMWRTCCTMYEFQSGSLCGACGIQCMCASEDRLTENSPHHNLQCDWKFGTKSIWSLRMFLFVPYTYLPPSTTYLCPLPTNKEVSEASANAVPFKL